MNADLLLDNAEALMQHLKKNHHLPILGYRIMGLLHERGDMTMGHLATALGRANPTLTGTVDSMEKAGLVQRIRLTDDRRSISIHLLKPELYLEARRTLNDRAAVLVS